MILSSIKYICYTAISGARNSLKNVLEKSEQNGIKEKFVTNLVRVDDKVIDKKKNHKSLFAIMRNESLRIEHFIKYYQNLGVDRFFIIDNNSTDNSVELIKGIQNVHIFKISDSYEHHWYWMEYLLDTYGRNHWCMVVDIDELFHYPGAPDLSLSELCNWLDLENVTAIRSFLLDMYANQEISSLTYSYGQNPLDVVTHFDPSYYSLPFTFLDRKRMQPFTTTVFSGGMRDRIFGVSNPPSILSKISLFKYLKGTYLVQGMHAINNAKVSEVQGVVFHTKFLSDFVSEVREECERGEHYGGAFYYKIFKRKLEENSDINLYYEGSVKFKDSQQLVDLGIMKTTSEFDAYTSAMIAKKQCV